MSSIYGICYDEGQSGNCGIECRGLLEGECPIPDEIADIFHDDFLSEYGDQFMLAVINAQDDQEKIKKFKLVELKRIMKDELGYEI